MKEGPEKVRKRNLKRADFFKGKCSLDMQEVNHLKVLPIITSHKFLLFISAPLLVSCVSTPTEKEDIDLEQTICGFNESVAFWLWNTAAGKPDPERIKSIENLQSTSFTTKDNRILKGYLLKAYASAGKIGTTKGYLLVAQGNAMLADQIISGFQDYSDAGYDVYIFDYRGYGRSEGKRRLIAIFSDYGEIIDHLNSLSYSRNLFYGMSFGGIVLLNALQDHTGVTRLVIDSTPSHISDYGCPDTHDPANILPADCTHLLLIAGDKDTVVSSPMSAKLLEVAGMRGASLLQDPDLAHPFMDKEITSHYRRMRAVRRFLLKGQ